MNRTHDIFNRVFFLDYLLPHPWRNSSLHLILYVVIVRSIRFFSILSFSMCILFSRIFLPTSYFWALIHLNLVDLLLSAIWKFRYIISSSHSPFRSNLCSISACLYMHIFSGIARLAREWISVCVSIWTFSLGMHSLHALADANLIFLFTFNGSPRKCQISEP